MTLHYMKLHNLTGYGINWTNLTWHDITWHRITWTDKKKHNVTPQNTGHVWFVDYSPQSDNSLANRCFTPGIFVLDCFAKILNVIIVVKMLWTLLIIMRSQHNFVELCYFLWSVIIILFCYPLWIFVKHSNQLNAEFVWKGSHAFCDWFVAVVVV